MGSVEAGGGASDDVRSGLAGAEDVGEFLLDAGNGGVKDGLRFVA